MEKLTNIFKKKKKLAKAEEREWGLNQIINLQLRDYLEKIISYVDSQLYFYDNRGKWRRLLSDICIGIALIMFSISLLLPLMKGPRDVFCVLKVEMTYYEVSYLSLVIASISLLFDKLFGFSAARMRYMLAKMELQKVVSEYHGKWIQSTQSLNLANLTTPQKNQLITTLLTFDNSIRKIVLDETNAWRTLFTKRLDEFTKTVSSRFDEAKKKLDDSKEKAEIEIQKERELELSRGILLVNFQKDEKSRVNISITGLEGNNKEFSKSRRLANTVYSCSFSDLKFGRYSLKITSNDAGKKKIIEKIELINKEDTKEVVVNLND